MAASYIPTKWKKAQFGGSPVNLATDTFVCLLVVAGAGIPNTTNAGIEFIADVTASNAEVTGTGYARQTLTGVTWANDGSVDTQVDFAHAAITFAQNAAGFNNARYVILADTTVGTADASHPVILVFDPGETLSAQAAPVVLSSPTGGELQVS